jgi:uracil-DNA glycosylase
MSENTQTTTNKSSDQNQGQGIQLRDCWKTLLLEEFQKPYMLELKRFLKKEKDAGKTIYPPGSLIFNALNTTGFEDVKVVILGQDPYHGPNQAHGLSFSVRKGIPKPPSLVNIFKEIHSDLNIPIPTYGDLTSWAEQGVLLLIATLTVEKGKANSHQGKGWDIFTDKIISLLNEHRENIVFLLWGSFAQKKGQFIDRKKHLVLEAPHPSPLSAHRGFLGCKHFSKTNKYLESKGIAPIDWSLPPLS